jgi:hypothetical protein
VGNGRGLLVPEMTPVQAFSRDFEYLPSAMYLDAAQALFQGIWPDFGDSSRTGAKKG